MKDDLILLKNHVGCKLDKYYLGPYNVIENVNVTKCKKKNVRRQKIYNTRIILSYL